MGIVIDVSLGQYANAPFGTVFSVDGSFTDVRELHELNILSASSGMPSAIVTDMIFSLPLKMFSTLPTFLPPIFAGMSALISLPTYLTIVAVPSSSSLYL